MDYRTETDSLGPVEVPAGAPWGAQTTRALANGVDVGRIPTGLWRALVTIKREAAVVNGELGLIEPRAAETIQAVADELLASGELTSFPLSPYMTGSGTSANMNVNEVLANLANERLGGRRGDKAPVHPNDTVNRCQSSNDVFPTAIHLAALTAVDGTFVPAAGKLCAALETKARAFHEVVKLGRTHLMDAVPVRLGSEFGAYAAQLRRGADRIRNSAKALLALPLGGTAVGTGVNAHPEFAERTIARLEAVTGLTLISAPDRYAVMQGLDGCVALSGALRGYAASAIKVANDLRWMASGPGGGLGEITLPAVQPGSSIMPGKVNPVIPEAVIQAMTQVLGLDTAVGAAGAGGVLELQLMMPLIGTNLLTMIELAGKASALLAEKCVAGIEADEARCAHHLERSLSLVTPLATAIGYDRAAEVANKAHAEGITLREAALALGVADEAELDRLLDPRSML